MATLTTQDSASADLDTPIDFVFHDSYGNCSDDITSLPAGSSIYADRTAIEQIEVDGGGDFELLRDLPLLSAEGEAFLFRKMNYLRFQAEQARISGEGSSALASVQQLVEDAHAVRNHIAECNLRLVISIARRFSTSSSDFDELMSEGNEILLKAISKFDFSRGYRFSTYATHSIQRHFFRYTQRVQKRKNVEIKSSPEILNEVPEAECDESISEWVKEEDRMTALIAQMAERLDEREHRIVVERFGLASNGVVRTLRELSADLGLSKERIRQLQLIAVDKLRDLFDELDLKPEAVSVS